METAQLLPAVLDIARILADQFRPQLGNKANDGGRAGVGIGLAIARGPSSVSIRTRVAFPW